MCLEYKVIFKATYSYAKFFQRGMERDLWKEDDGIAYFRTESFEHSFLPIMAFLKKMLLQVWTKFPSQEKSRE